MKKLLLPLMTLFGLLGMSHLSFAAGCPTQVCTCSGGGYVSFGEYCAAVTNNSTATSFAYIAVDPTTGKWASIDNDTSKSHAKKSVLSRCGKDCEYDLEIHGNCVSAAYSSEEQIVAFGSKARGLFDKSTNVERQQIAADKAVKKCEKKGGTNCKVLTSVCGHYRN